MSQELPVDRQKALDNLLDHYHRPRNRGPMFQPDVIARGGDVGCGDIVTIYVKVDGTGECIEQVTFEGEGCTISQAAASILTEIAVGKRLAEIDAMDFDDMIDLLGREVVHTRRQPATLALGTLKTAINQYRMSKRRAELNGGD
jgi:nitrogen fixation NifU-like protein